MLVTGTSYYPEDWDADRIAEDAALMREAGISLASRGVPHFSGKRAQGHSLHADRERAAVAGS